RIAQQQAMHLENVGFVLAEVLGGPVDDGVELLAGRGAGGIEAADFSGQGGSIQLVRFAAGKSLVEAVSAGNGNAGRDRHTFLHTGTVTGWVCRVKPESAVSGPPFSVLGSPFIIVFGRAKKDNDERRTMNREPRSQN